MLARENRILKPTEFRMVMSSGERVSTKHFVFYLKRDDSLGASRFGFVVSKMVGGAVTRNAVKRKLRAQARILFFNGNTPKGYWFVVRALPVSSAATSETIQSDMASAMAKLADRTKE